jgi:hypothetical protein
MEKQLRGSIGPIYSSMEPKDVQRSGRKSDVPHDSGSRDADVVGIGHSRQSIQFLGMESPYSKPNGQTNLASTASVSATKNCRRPLISTALLRSTTIVECRANDTLASSATMHPTRNRDLSAIEKLHAQNTSVKPHRLRPVHNPMGDRRNSPNVGAVGRELTRLSLNLSAGRHTVVSARGALASGLYHCRTLHPSAKNHLRRRLRPRLHPAQEEHGR